MAILDDYLTENNLTRYQVAKRGNIAPTTLQNAITRNYSVNRISVKVIVAIAEIVGKTPGTVLDEILELETMNKSQSDD